MMMMPAYTNKLLLQRLLGTSAPLRIGRSRYLRRTARPTSRGHLISCASRPTAITQVPPGLVNACFSSAAAGEDAPADALDSSGEQIGVGASREEMPINGAESFAGIDARDVAPAPAEVPTSASPFGMHIRRLAAPGDVSDEDGSAAALPFEEGPKTISPFALHLRRKAASNDSSGDSGDVFAAAAVPPVGDNSKPTSPFGLRAASNADHCDGAATSPPAKREPDGVPLEEEKVVRTGVIRYLDMERKYGLIIQDRKFRKIGQHKKERVLFHFHDIYPDIFDHIERSDSFLVNPIIPHGNSVRYQYQVMWKDNKYGRGVRGFNIRCLGGGDIAMLGYEDAVNLIRRARSKLGHDVYDILSEPSAAEVAEGVRSAFLKSERRVKWAKRQILNPAGVARECKTKLGEDVYNILTKIATVDDVEKRVEDAYFQCLRKLSILEINFTHKEGFDGISEP